MAYFLTPLGNYYAGDRAHALDLEVPQRPHSWDTWDKANAGWVPGQDPALANDNLTASAKRMHEDRFAKLDRHVSGVETLSQDEINKTIIAILKGKA